MSMEEYERQSEDGGILAFGAFVILVGFVWVVAIILGLN